MKRLVFGGALLALMGCDAVIVGDSIVYRAGIHTQEALGGVVHVDVGIGRGPYFNPFVGDDTLIEAVTSLAPHIRPGGTLVIQDDGSHETRASYGRFVDDVEAVVRDDVCIVWVAPWTGVAPERDSEILAAIVERADQRHAVARWDLVASVEVAPDGLHPNDAGSRAMADVIANAKGECR